ncbi:MAG: bifunctional nuclease family protein [Chloroflexota bacterium]|jgi:bifunctional DNase/RNase
MSSEMVEVIIDSIRVSLMSQQRIIVLREVEAERYLPIWIGVPEAESIAIALQEVEVVRPLTHDLLKKVFDAFEAEILRVEVTSLNDDIYYGNIISRIGTKLIEIDSRPSDALALAVRANVPILVSRTVINVAGLIPDRDLREGAPPETEIEKPPELVEGDVSEDRLSVFEDFLDHLDKTKKFDEDEENKE